MPSVAYREWQRWPPGFLEEVIEARAYGAAKRLVEAATTPEAVARLPRTRLVQLAREIELDIRHG